MVVREISYDHDMVCLLAGFAEITIKHDACARARWLNAGPVASRNVKTLNNDVMGRSQQEHPVRDA
jgi:hypothetical protein